MTCHIFLVSDGNVMNQYTKYHLSQIYYGTDYIISGPVYEYYSGNDWKAGLKKEINDDKLCGFTGKTVIHPNQISVVNNEYKVSQKNYNDALEIMNWDTKNSSLVSGNITRERMNEYKTHFNWAQKILYLAENYGIKQLSNI